MSVAVDDRGRRRMSQSTLSDAIKQPPNAISPTSNDRLVAGGLHSSQLGAHDIDPFNGKKYIGSKRDSLNVFQTNSTTQSGEHPLPSPSPNALGTKKWSV